MTRKNLTPFDDPDAIDDAPTEAADADREGLDYYDFSNVEEPVQIQPGTYSAQVANVNLQFSKQGNPMYVLRFQILEGEYEGRNLSYWMTFADKIAWRTMQDLGVILGHPVERGVYRFTQDNQDAMLGRIVRIKVRMGKYGEEPRPEIGQILPLTPSAATSGSR